MSAIAPRLPATSLGDMMRERGYVACRCGAQLKRTVGAWACTRKECEDLGRGCVAASRDMDGKDRASVSLRSSSPAPSKPAGRAAEDALASLLAGPYIVETFSVWLRAPRAEVFVRQFPVGLLLTPTRRYVADFYRCAGSLAVESKGSAHVAGAARLRRDNERDGLLVAAGIRVLPITPGNEHALDLVRDALRSIAPDPIDPAPLLWSDVPEPPRPNSWWCRAKRTVEAAFWPTPMQITASEVLDALKTRPNEFLFRRNYGPTSHARLLDHLESALALVRAAIKGGA